MAQEMSQVMYLGHRYYVLFLINFFLLMNFLNAISVLSAMMTLHYQIHHFNIHSTYTRDNKLRGIESLDADRSCLY